jgi:hypothetical protein
MPGTTPSCSHLDEPCEQAHDFALMFRRWYRCMRHATEIWMTLQPEEHSCVAATPNDTGVEDELE